MFTSPRDRLSRVSLLGAAIGFCACTGQMDQPVTTVTPPAAASVPTGGAAVTPMVPSAVNTPAAMGAPMGPAPTTPLPTMMPPTAGGDVVTPPAAAEGVTFHKDIRPIMVANCSMACHGPDPATRPGPMALDTYENIKLSGELVVAAIMSKKMPPWPQDESCRQMRDTPTITDEQRGLFMQWQMAGFPEGNEAEYVPPPADVESELGPPTRIVEMAVPHSPPPNTDEYYCGKGDHTFEKDTYIKAIEVIPDQRTMVHHVQVHIVRSAACTSGDNMYSWRPGGKRLTFSEGDAALLPAGSSFALQMHYNTIGKTPMPDKTKVALWELKDGEKPMRVVDRIMALAGVSAMPPGFKGTSRTAATVGGPGVEIIGVSPHAHMIAKRLNATASINGKMECLSEVPDWDFEWQLDYIFKEPIPAPAGTRIAAFCDYDNGPDNQPIVDGVKRQQPITVVPGEGSADEMCLHYIWTRTPVR